MCWKNKKNYVGENWLLSYPLLGHFYNFIKMYTYNKVSKKPNSYIEACHSLISQQEYYVCLGKFFFLRAYFYVTLFQQFSTFSSY